MHKLRVNLNIFVFLHITLILDSCACSWKFMAIYLLVKNNFADVNG